MLTALGQWPLQGKGEGHLALRESLLCWLNDEANDDDELRCAEWNKVNTSLDVLIFIVWVMSCN